jgi:hypothetical protein
MANQQLKIPVAPGELLDKLTILDIKLERITDSDKLANVRREHELLTRSWQDSGLETSEIVQLRSALLAVNQRLWQIEDDIRDCERAGDFGAHFVALARSVYRENDERAAIKKRINLALGSEIVEEKSYAEY